MLALRPEQEKFVTDLVEYGSQRGCRLQVFEMPTGSGKTIVSIKAALSVSEVLDAPVVVATSTNLLVRQAQKDIETFGLDLEDFAWVLGMTNYVSPAALAAAVETKDIHEEALRWLEDTGTGLISELETYLSKKGLECQHLKALVSIDPSFKGDENDGIEDERIFFLHALERAQNAKVVLTNHSIVLLPHIIRSGHLPPYRFLLLDEGHNFAQAARNLLNASFSPYRLAAQCKVLATVSPDQGIGKVVTSFRQALECFLDKAQRPDAGGETWSIKTESPQALELAAIAKKAKNFGNKLDDAKPLIQQDRRALQSFYKIRREVDELRQVIDSMRNPYSVTACSYSHKRGLPTYQTERQDSRFWLNSRFWPNLDMPVAILSGTVQMFRDPARDTFNKMFVKNLGIFTSRNNAVDVASRLCKPWCKRYESPFGAQTEVRIAPKDFPFPENIDGGGWEESNDAWAVWLKAVATYIRQIYLPRREKTLVLLGSYKDVGGLAFQLDEQVAPLGQNEILSANPQTSAEALARSFARGILIGTRQFWTGVDIPAIRHLVVARLPFPPLGELRWQKCKESRQDFPLYLWETVLLFRQGCGRLIRSQENRGVIHILDSRLHRKIGGITTQHWTAWAKGLRA